MTGAATRQHEIVCVKTLNKLKVRFLLAITLKKSGTDVVGAGVFSVLLSSKIVRLL